MKSQKMISGLQNYALSWGYKMTEKMKENIIAAIVLITVVLVYVLFNGWRADWNARCFFATDPSTCATIREVR